MNRGLGFANGLLFRGTPDGNLIAQDARRTSDLTVTVGDSSKGEYVTAAPLVWNGMVYVGIAGSDFGVRGRIMALDARSGQQIWRFNTVPLADEPGAQTWKSPAAAANGGGGTWSTYTLDEQSGELFSAVANPAPNYLPEIRLGDNLFTNSLVVLDARTGKLKWWYQVTPHDSHDWDLAAAPVLLRDASGASRVALGSKNGYVYVIDRSKHTLVFKTALVRMENTQLTPTPEGVHVCPGAQSGVHWNSPAYDPVEHRLIVGSVDACGTFKSLPGTTFRDGDPYGGGYFVADTEPPFGWISAIDARTGTFAWRYRSDAPIVAGITPTAGGVVFSGDLDGNFVALDRRSGRRLLSMPTGGAVAGGVITYAIDGHQYVATTSGNISRTSFKSTGTPRIIVLALDGPEHATVLSAAAPDPDEATTRKLGFVDINWGKLEYEKLCMACHAPQGQGGSGPSLRDLKSRRSIDNTIDWIKHPKAPMPQLYPAVLSEQDVADIATYIRSF